MASIQSKSGKSGKKTYYVVLSIGGRHKWIRAGSLKDAKILKREIESLEESKRFEKLGIARKEKRIDDFFREYLEYVEPRVAPNTVKRYRATINAFIAFLDLFCSGIIRLSQIKPEHIELFQQKRLKSVKLKVKADGEKPGNHVEKRLPKPQTVNYEVSVLRSAFIWAQDRELIEQVPTRKVKKLRVAEKKKARLLSPKECKALLKASVQLAKEKPRFKVLTKAFAFLLNTGLRSGELCNLTWDDIDLKTKSIKIQAKAGWTPKSYEREFFLNEAAVGILKSLKHDTEYVFVNLNSGQLKTDDLRRGLIEAAKRADIDGLTRVHDLRHTFSSILQMNGVDRGTVATILGHRDLSTTRIYTHQTQEHLKKSIDNVGIG